MSVPADRACVALCRALTPHLGAHRLLSAHSRDWSSATFEGARHRLVILLDGCDARARAKALKAMLAEADLPISGGLVADISIIARLEGDGPASGPVIGIEALTIADAVPPAPAGAISRDGRRAG